MGKSILPMPPPTLRAKRVAILVEDLYQDLEVWYPYYRLKEAGIEAQFVGTGKKEYRGKCGYPLTADVSADQVSARDYDGLIVPGGYAPDMLRRYPSVIRFVQEMHAQLAQGLPTQPVGLMAVRLP